MRRSCRKRKSVETRIEYKEYDELESEIKTEPPEVQFVDDASLVSCCCLCKISSGDNLAIFGSGPKHDPDIANKIQSCSGLQISSEANPAAQICCGCLQQLDGYYVFQKQALKCNEYAQNHIAETGAEFEILPGEIRVCRFCLKIHKKLLDMYPSGESPEYDLLQKIRECLAIQVNSWDLITKICRNCIKSIDGLFEFRTKHLPFSVYIKDETWHYESSKLAKKIKQEDEDTNKQELKLDLSVSDSDCSFGENEHVGSTCSGQQKRGAMRPELVQLIGAEVDGKNFSVLSEDDEQIKILFNDQLYRFHSERKNGSTFWICDNRKLGRCQMKLKIDANGKCATLSASVCSYTHPPGTAKLVQCLIGKGMAEMSSKAELLHTFCGKEPINRPSYKTEIWDAGEKEYETLYILMDVKKDTPSGFIFRRHRFSFTSVDQNGTSNWRCLNGTDPEHGSRVPRCRVEAIVKGMFESIVVAKQHMHETMSDSMMEHFIEQYASLTNSSGEKSMSLKKMQGHKRRKGDDILSILARHDPERNFTLDRTNTKLFVNYEGEDFRLKSRGSEGISTWSCIWLHIRKCPVRVRMSADGKQVSYCDAQKQHNHGDEQIGVFLQAPGKGQIYDKDNNIFSSYWLFSYQCRYRSSRGIIYQGNKYTLHKIANNGVSMWSCRNLCKVFVRVEGTFKAIRMKNEHNHTRLTDNEIKDITGHEEVDKALIPDCENSNAIVPISNRTLRPSAILRIMSLDDPDRNFQIKIQKEDMKVILEGNEFVYRSSTPSHTLWRCIYSGIRRCTATLQIDNHCKQAFRPKLSKHSHFLKPWKLYDYPLGENNIMDTGTGSEKPFWFLMQPTFIRPYPFIIYEDHRYSMTFITEKCNSSMWHCVQRECDAKLTVKGLFDSVVVKGSPHTHPPLAQEKKSEMIRLFGTSHENDTNSDS